MGVRWLGPITRPPMARTPAKPAPTTQADIDRLLDAFLAAGREQKAWEEHKREIAKQLSDLHEQGLMPTKCEHDGYSVSLQAGRKTIELDTVGKAKVDLLKADLIKQGHGEEKVGNPFWTSRELKKK